MWQDKSYRWVTRHQLSTIWDQCCKTFWKGKSRRWNFLKKNLTLQKQKVRKRQKRTFGHESLHQKLKMMKFHFVGNLDFQNLPVKKFHDIELKSKTARMVLCERTSCVEAKAVAFFNCNHLLKPTQESRPQRIFPSGTRFESRSPPRPETGTSPRGASTTSRGRAGAALAMKTWV